MEPEQDSQPNLEPIAPVPTQPAITANIPGAQNKLELAMGTIKIPEGLGRVETGAGRVPTHTIPIAIAGRFAGNARKEAAMKTGGTEKSEKAVQAGLRWLKNHQNPDGSWSDEFIPGMTGLSLLAFLGHGELPEEGGGGERVVWLSLAWGYLSDCHLIPSTGTAKLQYLRPIHVDIKVVTPCIGARFRAYEGNSSAGSAADCK